MPGRAIVFIHGRGPQDDPPVLKERWIDALKKHFVHPLDPSADVRLAYYTDIFYEGTPGVVFGRGSERPRIDADTLNHLIGHLRADDRVAPGAAPEASSLAFGLPRRSEDFAMDTLRYYGDDEYYEKVNGTLEKALGEVRDKQISLISHSMGTLVAYEVLSANNFKVDTWVTMGSPLGWAVDVQNSLPGWLEDAAKAGLRLSARFKRSIKRIRDHAAAALNHIFDVGADPKSYGRGLKQYPGAVDRWFNFYDPLDSVAAIRLRIMGVSLPALGDPTCADDFPMADGTERVFDVSVANAERPHYHSGTGYLKTRQIAQAISDFWIRNEP